jgi:hypothetical protein
VRHAPGYEVDVEEIPVPVLEKTGGGTGYGSRIAVRTWPIQAFWSRVYGGSPVPWSRLEVAAGQVITAKGRAGLHGDLRDAVMDSDGRHAWFLLTHGLARVDLEAMREVEVLRDRFPRYLAKLFDLGGSLLAATSWTGQTVTVVDRHEMRIRKTLRMPSPDAVVWDGGSSVELLSFNGSVARRLDLQTLTLSGRRTLPQGAAPVVSGRRAWIVEGPQIAHRDAPSIRQIKGTHIAEVDIDRAEVIRRSGPLSDPIRVVGLDFDGNVLVDRLGGVVLLDVQTLKEQFAVTAAWRDTGSAALLPDLRSAVVRPYWLDPERLAVVRWRMAGAA